MRRRGIIVAYIEVCTIVVGRAPGLRPSGVRCGTCRRGGGAGLMVRPRLSWPADGERRALRRLRLHGGPQDVAVWDGAGGELRGQVGPSDDQRSGTFTRRARVGPLAGGGGGAGVD